MNNSYDIRLIVINLSTLEKTYLHDSEKASGWNW